ncbi:MAG: hypothetical protein KJZ59_10405 [Pararhodobacter sp.]|nr:hypothetical protein [Pararhodobacter sp.]
MKLVFALGAVALLAACQISDPPAPRVSPPLTYAAPRAQPPLVSPPVAVSPPPRVSPGSPGAGSPGAAPPVLSPGPSGDTCGASRLQHLVGGPVPQPFPARGPVRIYASDEPVTMDHNPQRVNVEVTPGNRRRIVAISCG